MLKKQFKVSFYLRSNYKNKEGKSPIMLRIILDGSIQSVGSTKIYIYKNQWNPRCQRLVGKGEESVVLNELLDDISSRLYELFHEYEHSDRLSLDLLKSLYLNKSVGQNSDSISFMYLYQLFLEARDPKGGGQCSHVVYLKYKNVHRNFQDFLRLKYRKKDLLMEDFQPVLLEQFEQFLGKKYHNSINTITKKIKVLSTVLHYSERCGYRFSNPFNHYQFKKERTSRVFLTDDEILRVGKMHFSIPRLELVKDLFLFSCFTGLSYIDISNLRTEHLVRLNDRDWLMIKRQKTGVESNVLLLDLPLSILRKYRGSMRGTGKLLPSLSNQKLNAYLKEIADVCGIRKPISFHVARHTFATMILSKGVPMESVSRMLGHTNLSTTKIYARITDKKVEEDMSLLSNKLEKFNHLIK